MPLLSVEDLHTYYGEAHILQGVSLRLDEGEVVTLIGRNGAGKTTTLRSIMGIARPSRGRVTLRGDDLTRRPPHEISRRGIAWVPEERRILPNLTVLDNLSWGCAAPATPTARRPSTRCSTTSRACASGDGRSPATFPEESSRCSRSAARSWPGRG